MFIHLALVSSLIAATDIGYGDDTVPYLCKNSNLIITAAGVSEIQEHKDSFLLTVLVGETHKGKELKKVSVVISNKQVQKELVNSLLFLYGPMTKEETSDWNIPFNPDTFLIVSGRYGVLKPDKTVIEYIVGPDKEKLEWARKNVNNPNEFIQRSAIFEFDRIRQASGIKAVYDDLEKALSKVKLAQKIAIVNILEASKDKSVVSMLKMVAEDKDHPKFLRRRAAEALVSTNGNRILKAWQSSKDEYLRDIAEEIIKKK